MRSALAVVSLAILFACPAGADERLVTLDARARPLGEVVDAIAETSGRTIVVFPDVEETVTLVLHDAPWRQALDVVAHLARCQVVEDGETLRIEQPPCVTIQFTDANIRTVLRLLGAYSGQNLVVTREVSGTVTLDLKGVRWENALEVLSLATGVRVTRTPALTIVSTQPLTLAEEAILATLRVGVDLATLGGDGRVTVHTDDLDEARTMIAAAAGVVIEADPALRLPEAVALRAAPWREALRLLVDVCEARVVARDGGLTLVPRPRGTLQLTDGRLDLALRILGVACLDEPPRDRLTVDLIACTLDEAVVGLAIAGGFEPSLVQGRWRFLRRPAMRGYVPEEERQAPEQPRPEDVPEEVQGYVPEYEHHYAPGEGR
jgi:hypothetical protein